MVRSYPVLPMNRKPESRLRPNRFDSPPTAGMFTKVAPKPTNHSRFTGKCGRPRCRGCHQHPASKSINKTKATHKLRSANLVSNCRFATWRVVDAKPGLNFPGFSEPLKLLRMIKIRTVKMKVMRKVRLLRAFVMWDLCGNALMKMKVGV
ncbi:hypothetical protein LOK49_LG01G04127 [Camellia lanceoleosa]|uniref:Uncharacterized protein n=1 Tax=Camellia lanceoleosa TaxID=1840588 RepID=A0ACC0ITR1_9ERIC|nr:hypothetical protein LOK49_LG01G04127 [Camellia lanceoleosa]